MIRGGARRIISLLLFLSCSKPTAPAPGVAAGAACSPAQQNCASGLFCSAEWDNAGQCPQAGRCEALPNAPEIELSLPFPVEEVVYCAKGNLHAASTHNACNENCRFAFDFASTAADPPRRVLASADGIAYPFGGCASEDLNAPVADPECNAQWGNFVRVQHGDAGYTLYAHLSALLVDWGQRVRRGQVIGLEGNTGAAGTKHIHWGLHRGDARVGGESLPMRHVRTGAGTFEGRALSCGDFTRSSDPEPATRIVSENRPLPAPRQFRFAPNMAGAWADARSEDSATRQRFLKLFQHYMFANLEARYWTGVALSGEHRDAEALPIFEMLQQREEAPLPVRQWSALRVAEADMANDKPAAARDIFQRLKKFAPPSDRELVQRVERGLALLGP